MIEVGAKNVFCVANFEVLCTYAIGLMDALLMKFPIIIIIKIMGMIHGWLSLIMHVNDEM